MSKPSSTNCACAAWQRAALTRVAACRTLAQTDAYWGDWKFRVDAHDKKNMSLHFDRGGFQEARGSCGSGGHDWFIENVKELTDTYFLPFRPFFVQWGKKSTLCT